MEVLPMMPRRLLRFSLILLTSLSAVWALAASSEDVRQSARERLLEQIRYGETIHRDDLVEDATQRLIRIEPDAPEALVAQVYLATRKGDMDAARLYLKTLEEVAPGSQALAQAKALVELTTEEAQKLLAQARLFAAVGRVGDARKEYDALFKGAYPTVDLAVEYWRLRGREQVDRQEADQQLQALLKKYPRHPGILIALANYSFDDDRPEQGLQYLHELSRISSQREIASAREFEYLSTLPVTERSATLWGDFVVRYAGTRLETEALDILRRQRALLDDPVWVAGRLGLDMIEAGEGEKALSRLRAAVKAYPEDPQLLGGLGLAYLRMNDRAQALKYFELAKENELLVDSTWRWVSLIDSTQYWMLLNQASTALEKSNWALATRLYQQAHEQDPQNPFALVGLGDTALGQGQNEQAWRYYRQAFDLDPANSTAIRGLLAYLSTLEPSVALERLKSFPASQQRYLADLRRGLQVADLENKALAAQAQGHWLEASQWLEQAQALDLGDPWLSFRLANSLRQAGEPQAALQAYQRHLARFTKDPISVYAYGLLLESLDQWETGITALDAVPRAQWTDDMIALQTRLKTRLLIAKAQALYDSGDVDGAFALLEQPPQNTALALQLVEWSLATGRDAKALKIYQEILKKEPDNIDARLGELEVLIAQGKLNDVRQRLVANPPVVPIEETGPSRRLAMILAIAGDKPQALAIFRKLTERPGPADPLVYRDYARLIAADDPQGALDLYRTAMVASGLLTPPPTPTPSSPLLRPAVFDPSDPDTTSDSVEPSNATAALDDASFTRAMRTPDEPQDWLQSSIRSDAAELYQQNNPTLTLSSDSWFRQDGTPGVSQLRANTTMLQLDMPVQSGTGFLRADYITMNAGSFDTSSNGEITERFGTCILDGQTATGQSVSLPGCSNVPAQTTQGTAMALGWQGENWGFDIGHTPTTFAVSNWVGGINFEGDLGEMGWRVTVSRRPLANSLLSLAGTTDPGTGTVWGGVLATGATLSLSWDEGLENGVWANIGYHKLTGTNVADNNRLRLMGGYYRRLINKPNELLTAGVNAMYWRYDRDLSNFTFGQGGYYSPQMYASLGLPVSYARRWDDWSFYIQGSVSVSVARTNDQTYYPLMGAMPGPVNALISQGATPGSIMASNMSTGSTGTGFGYTLRGAIERRLGNHWVAGAAIDLQRSQDNYAPNRVMVYLKYFFKPWRGDLQLQPAGLTPYVDFN